MRWVNAALLLALLHRVLRDQMTILRYPQFMEVVLDLKHAFPRCIRDAVITARDRGHAFMADTALDSQNGIELDPRQRLQTEPPFSKRLIDHLKRRRMHTLICNACTPQIKLGVQVVNFAERSREKEVLADVAERSLSLALGFARYGWCAQESAIMAQQRDKGRVAVTIPESHLANYNRLHTVRENAFLRSIHCIKSRDMRPHCRLLVLARDNVPPNPARLPKHHREQRLCA